MAIKSLVFALAFAIVGYYYFEHSVLQMMKAISVSRDGPQSLEKPDTD